MAFQLERLTIPAKTNANTLGPELNSVGRKSGSQSLNIEQF